MYKFAVLALGICGTLGSVMMPAQEAQAPDAIRILLTRKDNIISGVGMGLTFDKERVEKALAENRVVLPEPFPPGAKVGFNYPDDFFVLFEKPEGRNTVVLTVDANMNRDLTDDAKVEILHRDKMKEGVVIKIKRTYPGPPPTEARLPYRFVYRTSKNQKGEIEASIFLSPAYLMEGSFFSKGGNMPSSCMISTFWASSTRATFRGARSFAFGQKPRLKRMGCHFGDTSSSLWETTSMRLGTRPSTDPGSS